MTLWGNGNSQGAVATPVDPTQFLLSIGGSELNGTLTFGPNGVLVFTDTNGVQWYSPTPLVNTSGQLITQMLSNVVVPQVGFVGKNTAFSNGTNGSVTLPPGVQTSDLILLFISAVNNGTPNTMATAPSGYTLRANWSDTSAAAGIGVDGWIYSKSAVTGGSSILWGASNNNIATLETALGGPLGSIRDYGWFGHWVSTWSTLAATHPMRLSLKFRTDTTNPVLATAVWNGSSGTQDVNIQSFCTNFVNMPAPPAGQVHELTFEHEMNAAAAQASGTYAQLVSAFQHCCNILRATPGFNSAIHKVAVCVTGSNSLGDFNNTVASYGAALSALYNPGTYADVVWIDQPYYNTATATASSLVGDAIDWYTNNTTLPIEIGEWGVIASLTSAQIQSRLQDFANFLKTSRASRVTGVMYWNNGAYAMNTTSIGQWAALKPGTATDAGNTITWILGTSAKQNAIVADYRTALSLSSVSVSVSDDTPQTKHTAPALNVGAWCLEYFASACPIGSNTYADPIGISRRAFAAPNGPNSPDGLLIDSNGKNSNGGDSEVSSETITQSISASLTLGSGAISFVDVASTIANAATISQALPNTIQAGDTIYLFADLAFGGTDVALNTPPAGYTLVTGGSWVQHNAGPTASIDAWLYKKTAVGGDAGATVSFTFASAVKCEMTAMVYRGVVSETLATGGDIAQTAHVLPSVSAHNWVVGLVSSRTGTANTYTVPAGYVQRDLQQGSGGGNVDAFLCDSNGTSSTGGGTSTCSASGSVAVMFSLALS